MRINLPESVKKIIAVLEKHGYEAFAVGGCVRDSLLGKEPKDWDITTSARPEQVKALFHRTIDTGIQHGTVTIMMNHVGYEVTTYRIDGEYEDGRHPKEVVFTSQLVEDLKRRDFTINAMAYSDRTGIVDEFNGMSDLENKVIRCVGVAAERFTEDALRILRAVRFSAQLGCSIEKETMAAAERLAHTLQKISRERIQAELEKLLMSDYPDRVLMLQEKGILKQIFSEEKMCGNISEEEQNTAVKTLAEKLMKAERNHYVRWALFVTYVPYENILKSLKFDNKTILISERIYKYRAYELSADKPLLRHAIVEIGQDIFDDYLIYRKELEPDKDFSDIEAGFDTIIADGDCLSLKTMKINGADLIALGVEPGQEMGQILNGLFELVLNDASCNEHDILVEIVKKQHVKR